MFSWSKTIMKKIVNKEELTERDKQNIEMALRMWDSFENVLDEPLCITEDNFFELEYKHKQFKKQED